MTLDDQTQSLIGVGASIAANCWPCLQANLARALEYGLGEQELREAINLGKFVRQAAALQMDRLAIEVINASPMTAEGMDRGCECGSRATSTGGIDE
jgi:alkylhydroperoxidase/carboxymuconolactone decarboxylase family protein YurZ